MCSCLVSLPISVALLTSIFKLTKPEELEGIMKQVVSKAVFNDEAGSLEHALVTLDDYLEVRDKYEDLCTLSLSVSL